MPMETDDATARPKLLVVSGRMTRGKSVFIRWLVERGIRFGRPLVVCDLNRTNSTLRNYINGVVSPEQWSDADIMTWLGVAIERQVHERVSMAVDMCGGDQLLMQHGAALEMVPLLESRGIEPVIVHLLGPSLDDIAYVRDLEDAKAFCPAATVMVLNEAAAPRLVDRERPWEEVRGHAVYKAVLARGARQVWMPRLDAMAELESRHLTFEAAAAGQVPTGTAPLGIWNQQRVVLWLREMERAFASVVKWLP